MNRVVEPEWLDQLPATDPRAVASRADLRQLNFIMGHAGILTRQLRQHLPNHPPPPQRLQVVELGAGDGSLAAELARRWAARGILADWTLIDQANLVSPDTLRTLKGYRGTVRVITGDAFAWLEQRSPPVDVLFTNLFLHHFTTDRLRRLLSQAATRAKLFLACEPRRSVFALRAAQCLGLLGCGPVTQHDAVVSVRAGFADQELSQDWPQTPEWRLHERPAGLFSHVFAAHRHD